jgi:hypothetical protein
VVRIEMLNQDQRHAGDDRHLLKKARERFKSASGCPNTEFCQVLSGFSGFAFLPDSRAG